MTSLARFRSTLMLTEHFSPLSSSPEEAFDSDRCLFTMHSIFTASFHLVSFFHFRSRQDLQDQERPSLIYRTITSHSSSTHIVAFAVSPTSDHWSERRAMYMRSEFAALRVRKDVNEVRTVCDACVSRGGVLYGKMASDERSRWSGQRRSSRKPSSRAAKRRHAWTSQTARTTCCASSSLSQSLTSQGRTRTATLRSLSRFPRRIPSTVCVRQCDCVTDYVCGREAAADSDGWSCAWCSTECHVLNKVSLVLRPSY